MCGIAGFVASNVSWGDQKLQEVTCKMAETLAHRGPDDAGVWVDAEVGLGLGHRRLAIIDLSQEGHQPMLSACGRYVIVYNGEIYNYPEIKKQLQEEPGYEPLFWRGHSDTEVMLAAIARWGLEKAVQQFTGMFAFALWDRRERKLYLVRDRLGEKPLYYGRMGQFFLFASELKALRLHPAWQGEINRDALALFLRYNYIPAPYSIYRHVYKLPPGTILTISWQDDLIINQPAPYWSMQEVAASAISEPFTGSEPEALVLLENLLQQIIRSQMIADVPLGAFLSGGIDSSTVVALMQAQSSRPIRTFSIGFYETGYNEAEYAKAVARHLGTDHTELYVTPEETMAVIPEMPVTYDEPFADSSQIPTFLLAKLTRRHVRVSLSGDGGDELFGGYVRYLRGKDIWNKIQLVPAVARTMAPGLKRLTPQTWQRLFHSIKKFLPDQARQSHMGHKLYKLAEMLSVASVEEWHKYLLSYWKEPTQLVLNSHEPFPSPSVSQTLAKLPEFTQKMMYLDTIAYLPDDILVKVDRATMAVSLESRAPLLDHRLVQFAWSLPVSWKVNQGQGKIIFRQLLAKFVPGHLTERPKSGFGLPIDIWLRGSLRDWAESLLTERRLREEKFFNPGPVLEKWHEHLSGETNWHYYLWGILMFQAWIEVQK